MLDDTHPATVLAAVDAPPEACGVAWAAEDGIDRRAELAADGTAVLFGAPAPSRVTAWVECVDGRGAEARIDTPAPPTGVPSLVVDGEPDAALGDALLTSALDLSGTGTVLLVDPWGRPLWWTETFIAQPRWDAESGLVYGSEEGSVTEEPVAFVVSRPAGPDERWEIPHVSHDSVALGDGRYLLTVSSRREVDGELVAGDTLVVLDTTSGGLEVVWDAFDELPIVENDGWKARNGDGSADWTHINGLALDGGKLYASLFYERSVVRIDTATWRTDWTLGGPRSDFAVDEPFGPQHSPEVRGGRVWLFDNGAGASAVQRYRLDEVGRTATREWAWAPTPDAYTPVLGSVSLVGERLLTAWGSEGAVHSVDTDGTIRSSYHLPSPLLVGLTTAVSP